MTYDFLVTENKTAFLSRVTEISAALGISPDWLMIVMKMESNINHRAVNPQSGATGLIQFMPRTAAGLGTTTEGLKAMSNVAQLDYVHAYFKPYSGRIKGLTDLYMITFFPVGLGKPDTYILQTDTLRADTIARQNPGFDLDKNQAITVGEFKKSILNRVPGNIIYTLEEAADFIKKKIVFNPVNVIVAAFILILTLSFINKYIKK